MTTLNRSLRLLAGLTLLTGFLYPLSVWVAGRRLWPEAAEGQLVRRADRILGSALLAQPARDPRHFWPRPSAGAYATVASGASQQAWTNAVLARTVAERRAALGGAPDLPPDLLTASGSGLDPHLSPAAARAQLARVAAARRLDAAQAGALAALLERRVEGGQFSPARINVLLLNLELDARFPE
ncbi:MAG: potassium-transporting ATPase subunit C [Opitutaceae bacterium]|nr:potassium-transporting ATPase subunit C [Opitutaceae bacterium]